MSAGMCRLEVLTVAAFGSSGRPSAGARRKGSGAVMVPENMVQRWEIAYRQYGNASKAAGSAVPGDPEAARGMAEASRNVAAAWREMERIPELPWWAQAALVAGAQAFEFQARDWNARADYAWPPDAGGSGRPPMRLSTRPRPRPRHGVGESGE